MANHRRASHAHFPYTTRNFENAPHHPPVSGQQCMQSPPSRPFALKSSYRRMDASLLLGFALCCHSNATGAPIANPPNSAQLGGSLYHAPSYIWVHAVVWAYGCGQTHTQTRAWPQYILHRLRLTQNVTMVRVSVIYPHKDTLQLGSFNTSCGLLPVCSRSAFFRHSLILVHSLWTLHKTTRSIGTVHTSAKACLTSATIWWISVSSRFMSINHFLYLTVVTNPENNPRIATEIF